MLRKHMIERISYVYLPSRQVGEANPGSHSPFLASTLNEVDDDTTRRTETCLLSFPDEPVKNRVLHGRNTAIDACVVTVAMPSPPTLVQFCQLQTEFVGEDLIVKHVCFVFAFVVPEKLWLIFVFGSKRQNLILEFHLANQNSFVLSLSGFAYPQYLILRIHFGHLAI